MAYISAAQITLAINEEAIQRFTDEQIEQAIEAASGEADTYLTGAYSNLPLEDVDIGLKLNVARAAVFHLFSVNGGASGIADDLIERNYDRAIAFYKAIQKSQQNLPSPPTSPKRDQCVVVSSNVKRGW